MIDLSPFYDPRDIRHQITAPFSDADFTYATNGDILIRVARRPEIAEAPFAANCFKLLAQFAIGDDRQWFGIPALPEAIIIDCMNCCTADYEPDGPCEDCHDTKRVEQPQSVDVGDCYFARKYLAILAALPACTISPNGKNGAWWKCGGADGLLMPMTRRMP